MAGFPAPRRRINPALRDAVRASGRPGHVLAIVAGLHHSKLSALINADSVPATATTLEQLRRIAAAVGFDPAALFIDGGDQ